MALKGREIAVIGAGIGGLAAAVALAQRGAKVRVFERAPDLREVGAGLQLGPNAVAVLQALGLGEAALQVATVPADVALREFSRGDVIARLELGDGCVKRYGRPYWQFHRADLLQVLVAGATEAGVEILTGAEVTGIEPREGYSVVRTGDNEARFEIVIAADGVRSGIRLEQFAGVEPRFTGHVAWRGLVDAEKVPGGQVHEGTCVTMGHGRHLVTYPLRHGKVINFVAVEERPEWTLEGWMQKDVPENLRAAFDGWDESTGGVLDAVSQTFIWGLFDHPPLSRWVDGNLVLLGDACHPMLPYLAQGAAMALEDAWVLAAEIDATNDTSLALVNYEQIRRPRATRVQKAAASNGHIFHLPKGLSSAAHLGMKAAAAFAPDFLLSRLDWLYGEDVTVADYGR